MEKVFHPKKLTLELQEANIPVVGVSSSGRVDYARSLSKAEKSAADAIIAAHDPVPTDKEIEKDRIQKSGFTDHDLLMVLWKKIMCADSSEADILAIKIADIL